MKKNNGRRGRKLSSVKQRDGVHLLSSRRARKPATSASIKPKKSKPEEIFEKELRAKGYRNFITEFKFMLATNGRRWRFDFAWAEAMIAIEIEGGIFMRGRHVRPSGFINDCEKYNAATQNGWRVFRVPVCKGWLDAAMLIAQTERLT